MTLLPRACVLFLLTAAFAAAQEDEGSTTLYVETRESESLRRQADKFEKEGRWRDAVERYQKLLKDRRYDVAPMDKKETSWRGLAAWVIERVRAFPPEGFQVYREINDPYAEAVLKEALKSGDAEKLADVANTWFLTSAGDNACVALASMLEDRGHLPQAALYLERALMEHPTPDVPAAVVAVRWGLACRRSGDAAGWDKARAKLATLQESSVTWRGKSVKVAEMIGILQEIEPPVGKLSPSGAWNRIGGNNSGTGVGEAKAKNEVRLWSVSAKEDPEKQRTARNNMFWPGQGFAAMPFVQVYPAVTRDGVVIFAEGRSVCALDIATGQVIWDGGDKKLFPEEMFLHTMRGQPRILSMVAPVVQDNIAYVTFLPEDCRQGGSDVKQTRLDAIDVETGKVLWTTDKEEKLNDVWFGSPPVVLGGKVYAAVTLSAMGDATAEMVVLDARTGRLINRVFIASNSGGVQGWNQAFFFYDAPTIAEANGVLYVNTNVGAAAALQADTCDILWIQEYVAAQKNIRQRGFDPTMSNGRGLSPIVIDKDRVCFLPGDSERYLELDARTGMIHAAVSVKLTGKVAAGGNNPFRMPSHFLGVRDGFAWFQSSEEGAYFLKLDRTKPMPPEMTIYGALSVDAEGKNQGLAARGMLLDTTVAIPAKKNLLCFALRHGKRLSEVPWANAYPLGDPGSILMLGERLLTWSETGISCFVGREVFDRDFGDVLTAANPDPDKLTRHAEVMALNIATIPAAIVDYERLVATQKDPVRVAAAKLRLTKLHVILGDRRRAEGSLADAIKEYRKAILAAPSGEDLPAVFQVIAECHFKLEEWGAAAATWQEAIEAVGDNLVTLENGARIALRDHGAEKIAEIIQKGGIKAYEGVEKRAKEMYEKSKENVEELKKWLRTFPLSSYAPEATRELAKRLEAQGSTLAAATELQRLVEHWPADAGTPQAVADAARLLTQLGLRDRAWGLLARLERAHGTANVVIAGRSLSGVEAAAALRGASPVLSTPNAPSTPRVWAIDPADAAVGDAGNNGLSPVPTLIVPAGTWTGLDPNRVVLISRLSSVEARDVVTGAVLWSKVDPRGWMGITWDSNDNASTRFEAVSPGGPADKAGFLPNDLPVAWDGQPIDSRNRMRRLISLSAGKTAEVTVARGAARVTLKLAVGVREETNEHSEPIQQVLFADNLLFLARNNSVQAIDPVTGKQVWVHCPAYSVTAAESRNTDTRVTGIAAADGRVFISWWGALRELPSEVSLEALDATTGLPLWSLGPADGQVIRVFAAEGTGTLVKADMQGPAVRLRRLNPATGTQIGQEKIPATAPDTQLPFVELDGHRLAYLRETNSVCVLDLATGRETVRVLGAERTFPDAIQFRGDRIALSYAPTQRILVAPLDPAQPVAVIKLAEGAVAPNGLHLEGADRLFVLTSPGPGGRPTDTPDSILRRFQIGPEGAKETWKRVVAPAGGLAGAHTSFPGHVMAWSSEGKTGKASTALSVLWLTEGNPRVKWEARDEGDEAGGMTVNAGVQGELVWGQFDGKVVIWK